MAVVGDKSLWLWRRMFGRLVQMAAPPEFPTIVCLCGSTRFIDAFQKAKYDETLAGRIVLTIGCDTKSDGELFSGPEGDAIKARLDELHKRKIDLASEILVLNLPARVCPKCKTVWPEFVSSTMRMSVDRCGCGAEIGDVVPVGYVGESTRSEILYAVDMGKRVRWLYPELVWPVFRNLKERSLDTL